MATFIRHDKTYKKTTVTTVIYSYNCNIQRTFTDSFGNRYYYRYTLALFSDIESSTPVFFLRF